MKGTLSEEFCLVGISMVQISMSMYGEGSRMTVGGWSHCVTRTGLSFQSAGVTITSDLKTILGVIFSSDMLTSVSFDYPVLFRNVLRLLNWQILVKALRYYITM